MVRRVALFSLLWAACSDSDDLERLDGAIDLTLSSDSGQVVSVTAEGLPDKFRAQIEDDGERCVFDAWVDLNSTDQRIDVNTYSDEIEDLLAGLEQVIQADSNTGRSLTINAATVFLDLEDDGRWYSASGLVTIDPLPAPVERLRMVLTGIDAREVHSDGRAALEGSIEFTYLGAIQTKDGRACPEIELYPGGLKM